MSQYSVKSCYDCGIRRPADEMKRVTESFNSGRSDNKITAGNLTWAALGSKTATNKVKKNIVANNRRSYTRNRTVWKCLECSGTNARLRGEVRDYIQKATKLVEKAEKGGLFSAPKTLPESVYEKLIELESLDGETCNRKARLLLEDIRVDIKDAPAGANSPKPNLGVAKTGFNVLRKIFFWSLIVLFSIGAIGSVFMAFDPEVQQSTQEVLFGAAMFASFAFLSKLGLPKS